MKSNLARDLEQYLREHPAMPHIRAFSGMWKDAGAKMLRQDLELAGIEYQTDAGVVHFYSLRHTFGTLLAKSGVMPQDAQKLMHHSDINLTMGIYTHLQYLDKAKVVSKLPDIRVERRKFAKTGTTDVLENFTANFTGNSVKTHKNTAKSNKDEVHSNKRTGDITLCKST